MKGYTTLPKSPEMEPHYQMQVRVIPRTFLFGGVFLGIHSTNSYKLGNRLRYNIKRRIKR